MTTTRTAHPDQQVGWILYGTMYCAYCVGEGREVFASDAAADDRCSTCADLLAVA